MTRNSTRVNRSYPETQTQSGVVFHVHNIAKVYRMGEVEVHALRSIDLDLYEGEFVVLLGASGSGKSTLLNILGGLDVPTSGHILFRDRDLTHASEAELTRFRRDCVGFIFQSFNANWFLFFNRISIKFFWGGGVIKSFLVLASAT